MYKIKYPSKYLLVNKPVLQNEIKGPHILSALPLVHNGLLVTRKSVLTCNYQMFC